MKEKFVSFAPHFLEFKKRLGECLTVYWQASQSGLSMEQNFASVAGDASPDFDEAMMGSAGFTTDAPIAIAAPAEAAAATPPETGTALSCPVFKVLFSAWVAPMVRR